MSPSIGYFSKLDAKNKVGSFKLARNWLFAIAFSVTFALYLFRLTGALQPLELAVYDFLVSSPVSASSNSITIVAIQESDLQNLQQYPISDRTLAKAISDLNRHQPIAIGLDIYRDLPVEPGNQELTTLLANTPNIIGIEKLIGSQINPNPTLAVAKQVGFNDLALDPDTVVRRAILSYQKDTTEYSFALQLALRYLRTRDILPKQLAKDDSTIKLGKSIITPLKPNSGSYIKAKTKGYQIAINYQGAADYFTTYSFQDLLTDQIPPEAIKDRVILMGATAASLNDLLLTPHRQHQLMPGIYIHANIIDHLIDVATTGKGFIKVWHESQEVLWFLLWATVGTIIARQAVSDLQLGLLFLLASCSILLVTYSGWLLGWWVPVIPALLALFLASVLTKAIANYESNKRQLRYAVQLLAQARKDQPAASRIALEYLKLGESSSQTNAIEALYQKRSLK